MGPKKNILLVSILLVSVLAISPHIPSASEVPGVIELDGIGNIYGPVTFDHIMHMDIASCATCHHHTTGMPAEDERCVQCHADSCTSCEVACIDCHSACPGCAEKVKESQQSQLFHIDTAGLTRAYHLMCVGCHEKMDTVTGCQDCHLKKEDSLCKD